MKNDKFELIPGRVQAALQYVEHCNRWITDPFVFCEFAPRGRAMNPSELAAYRAALDTVRQYFAGEMDYGGVAPRAPEDPCECKKCRKRRDAAE